LQGVNICVGVSIGAHPAGSRRRAGANAGPVLVCTPPRTHGRAARIMSSSPGADAGTASAPARANDWEASHNTRLRMTRRHALRLAVPLLSDVAVRHPGEFALVREGSLSLSAACSPPLGDTLTTLRRRHTLQTSKFLYAVAASRTECATEEVLCHYGIANAPCVCKEYVPIVYSRAPIIRQPLLRVHQASRQRYPDASPVDFLCLSV
jgi:hypothetical protein